MRRVLPLLLLSACADVTPPDDGLDLGPVVQVKDWFTSAYVARTGDGAILFDAGFREGRMERGLDDVGVRPEEVQHVLLTHGHGDHVGALDLYPQATVWAHPDEAPVIAEEAERSADREVADGQILDLLGQTIEVFHVPGHTPGSVVYRIDGVLILGDTALQARDGTFQTVPEGRSADPAQARRSLEALGDRIQRRDDLSIEWLAPAHSAPLQGLAPLADYTAADQ